MQIDTSILLEGYSSLITNLAIHGVVVAAVIDILTGMAAGYRCEEMTSSKGLNGVIKHMCIIGLILIVYPYMTILNLKPYANLFVGFYIITYIISIFENLSKMGVRFPKWVENHLSKVKHHLDEGGGSHANYRSNARGDGLE